MSNIFDALNEPKPRSLPATRQPQTRHDFPELDVDLNWRPWRGQVKPKVVPCPCTRCQAERDEAYAVCERWAVRNRRRLTSRNEDFAIRWLDLLQTSVAFCAMAWLAWAVALRLADWALLHYRHLHP